MKTPHQGLKQISFMFLLLFAGLCSYATHCGNTIALSDTLTVLGSNEFRMTVSSSGSYTYLVWKFGDGSPDSVTTVNSVIHEYPDTGYYNRCVIAVYVPGNCSDTVCSSLYVAGCNINADFSYVQGGYCAGLMGGEHCVQFISTSSSTAPITSFQWMTPGANLNSGSGSYFYNSYNSLTSAHPVTLIVANSAGCRDTLISNILLDTCVLRVNRTLNFQNTDPSNPDTLFYNLNATSTHTPLHFNVYYAGTYYDTLGSGMIIYPSSNTNTWFYSQVYDGIACFDSLSQNLNLQACNVNANFSYQDMGNRVVQFNNTSTSNGGILSIWLFENSNGQIGSTSNTRNPLFTFSGNPPYRATLYARDSLNGGCWDTVSLIINLTLASPCGTASLTASVSGASIQAISTSIPIDSLTCYSWKLWSSNGAFIQYQPGCSGTFTTGGQTPGNYSVCIYLTHPLIFAPCDTACQSVTVPNVNCSATNAQFTYQSLGNNTAQFTNGSASSNGYRSSWIFRNANGQIGTSTFRNPLFAFTGNPPFSALLQITDSLNSSCSDTAFQVLSLMTAQNYCVSLRPRPNMIDDVDALITQEYPDSNLVRSSDLMSAQWNVGGVNKEYRSLFHYILSFLPTGTTINSAYLNLYANPNSVHGNPGAPTSGTANASYLKRITQSWAQTTVTWNNQPPTTTTNQVLIPQSTGTSQNYQIDVSSLVQFWIQNPSQNFGMMLDMIATNANNSMIFCSYDYPDSTKWPQLVVCYTPPCSTNAQFTYQNNGGATVQFSNFSSSVNHYTSAWTFRNATGPVGTSTVRNPQFTYTGNPPYTAQLLIVDTANSICRDSISQILNMTVQNVCLSLQPGPPGGIDAEVDQFSPNSNIWTTCFFSYQTNSFLGSYETRSLLKFDLSAIPPGATINSAFLSLYANTTTVNGNTGSPMWGNNASYLKRVTSPWADTTVTWNTQPTTVSTDQILLQQSANVVQDYPNIDLLTFTQYWNQNPAQNFGMMLDNVSTSSSAYMIFASSNYQNASRRPKLEICFTPPAACNIHADFAYTLQGSNPNNPDTIIISNGSISNSGIGTYEVSAHNSTGNLVYFNLGLSPYTPAALIVPHDTTWNVCISVSDTGRICADTLCKIIYNFPCATSAAFAYVDLGNLSVQFTNNSTSHFLPGFSWIFANNSGTIGTSTARNPLFTFSGNPPYTAQLLVIDTILGCPDTTFAPISLTSFCTTSAAFTYQDLGNLSIQFSNSSSSQNSFTSAWVFRNSGGQMGTSTARNPLFTFSGNPPYSAQLLISDSILPNCQNSFYQVLNLNLQGSCYSFDDIAVPNANKQHAFNIYGNGHVGFLQDWKVTSGTPSIQSSGDIPGVNAYNGNQYALAGVCDAGSSYSEGVSLQHNFIQGQSYTVSMAVRNAPYLTNPPTPMDVDFILLQNPISYNYNSNIGCSITPAIPAGSRLVYSLTNYSQNSWQVISFPISNLTSNYTQLWIRCRFSTGSPLITSFFCFDSLCYSANGSCPAAAQFMYQDFGNGIVHFNNTSTSANGYFSVWTFRNSNGQIGSSTSRNPQFTFSGNPPYTAQLQITDSLDPLCQNITSGVLNLALQNMCITIRPDSITGKDADIEMYPPNSNQGSCCSPSLLTTIWTHNGSPDEQRALLQFDLSSIPPGSIIQSATLSLYADVTTPLAVPGSPTYGTNNASYLKRITSGWTEAGVSWNSQPSTTTLNQVLLPQSVNTAQDYPNINVTAFAQYWMQNPAQNYGMMIDMITSNHYNSMIFCSSEFPDPAKRPKLVVCYAAPGLCSVQANYSYSIQNSNPNNTVTITNTSTTNNGYGNYQIATYYSNGSLNWVNSGLSPYSPFSFTIPHDSAWYVCLHIADSSGSCFDSICRLINVPCSIHADFAFTATGSAVLYYNTSTDLFGSYTSAWNFPGGTPSTSTAVNPVVTYTQNGSHLVCLRVTDALGCTDSICKNVSINFFPNDTLCGLVFNDRNGNGIFDVGETRFPYANVRIDGFNYYTNSQGFYNIGVGAGTHSILLNAPIGWSQTFPTNPLVYSIVTIGNDYICGLDFGMKDDTLVLSGVVYTDSNGNGLYDPGDSPRSSESVSINGPNGSYTLYTNSSGRFSQVVYSGTYTISYTIPQGYVLTQPINPNNYSVTVVSTGLSGLNFGVFDSSVVITGLVYVDGNNNGTYENGEALIGNQPVHVGNRIVYSNASGIYSASLGAGNYTVTYTPSGPYAGYSSTPSTYAVNAPDPGITYGGNNFGLSLAPGTGDVCVSLSPLSCVSSGFPAWYHIYVYNNGNIPMQGTLFMYYDPNLVYFNASINPTAISASTQVLSWDLISNVGQTISLTARFNYPAGIAVGTPVFNAILFSPAPGFTDVNPSCNMDTIYQEARASWDPNGKQVSPVGLAPNGRIDNDQRLDYTITFQNEGNAPAVNVIVLDTLDEDLDLSTFLMTDASHEYHLQTNGRELTWIFSNIMLPDSATDYYNSMGYVSYSIKPLPLLEQGTHLLNTGNIYFDYNEVVVTNQTRNTIDYTLSIADLEKGNLIITLQPNPFSEFTTIKIEGEDGPYELKVFDILGNLVRNETSDNNTFSIARGNLAAGLYLYNLTRNSKLIGTGKMVAE